MEGIRVYDCSDLTVLLPTQKPPPSSSSSQVLDSFWISNSSPSFQGDSVSGSTSMVNFEKSLDKEENGNEEYDRCSHRPEKKRRLAVDQVEFLERSFEVENKLGPERKVQLANELRLQPRQIAIWFQNRRARYKSKLIEKDYDCLKASYDKLKADHDSLLKDNEKLKIEVHLLKEKLLLREKGKAESEPCDPINSLDTQPQKAFPNTISQNVPMVCDANSAKSDVFDSDSPRYTDGNHSSVLEPAVSSHVRGPEHSDFSQDEEDNLRRTILPLPCFPKLEEGCYHELNANSCNLGYTVEDEPFWFWPY